VFSSAMIAAMVASAALQLTAAWGAIRLIRVTGRSWAWILVSAGILLMAIRRIYILQALGPRLPNITQTQTVEILFSFVISVILLSGILLIRRPLALLRQSRNDAEDKERQLQLLFAEMPTGFALHEMLYDGAGRPSDYRFLYANAAFERLTGLRTADIVGRTVREIIPAIEDYWIQTYGEVVRTGQAAHFEQYSEPLHKHFAVTAYSPAPNRFAVIFSDVTTLKNAEEERRRFESQLHQTQKLESLGVLAGGIAHDFNNLLVGVLGNADLALSELPTAHPARENLADLEKAARRAADLCRQLLAYSGKGRFAIEKLDLSALVRDMAHMLEIGISRSVHLRYELADKLPAIEGDATQLRQVVMNLITNAGEAIGDQSGSVTLVTGAMDCDRQYLQELHPHTLEGGVFVYLEVTDTGCGMDKATVARMFEPFFTTKFTGRGLGLAAVQGIVKGHGGVIKVYSEPGRGTSVKVLFPAAGAPVAPAQPLLPLTPAWKGEGTILLVDDDATVLETATRMLTKAGFTVLTARDGREAVEVFRTRQSAIRCVVLDLTMPQMGGEAAFRELRRLQPNVRVLLSSGYNEQEVVQRFAGKRLTGFVQKPYQSAALLQALEAVLRG
jgi:PAS domain S-box-containing protein